MVYLIIVIFACTQVNDGHLREFFGDVGGVTAIRLVKDKFTGKPKVREIKFFSEND